MLIAYDVGGRNRAAFTNEVVRRYGLWAGSMECDDVVNTYLQYSGRGKYVPYVMVSSCPGDV